MAVAAEYIKERTADGKGVPFCSLHTDCVYHRDLSGVDISTIGESLADFIEANYPPARQGKPKARSQSVSYSRLAFCLMIAGKWRAAENEKWGGYYENEAARIRRKLRPIKCERSEPQPYRTA